MSSPALSLFFQPRHLGKGYRGYLAAFRGFLDALEQWDKVPGFQVAALVCVYTLERGEPMPPPAEDDPQDELTSLAGHLFALERQRLIAWLERLQEEGRYSQKTMSKLAWRQRDLESTLMNALAGVEPEKASA